MNETVIVGVISTEEQLLGKISSDQHLVGIINIPTKQEEYRGIYEVTPSREMVELQTNGLSMARNVIINPIPSNYGLITWNGSVLTVS